MSENRFQHPLITDALFDRAIDGIPARMHGMHGLPHWLMVERNGLILAEKEGGDALVVSLFALLHDSRRINDEADPDHGPRAAILATQLHAEGLLPIDETQLSQLVYACKYHTDEIHTHEVTIGCCWDGDRLDLIRCGVTPDPEYLNTETAKRIADGDFLALIRQSSFSFIKS